MALRSGSSHTKDDEKKNSCNLAMNINDTISSLTLIFFFSSHDWNHFHFFGGGKELLALPAVSVHLGKERKKNAKTALN